MLHTNNAIIKHKAGFLNLAEELDNVSKSFKAIKAMSFGLYVAAISESD